MTSTDKSEGTQQTFRQHVVKLKMWLWGFGVLLVAVALLLWSQTISDPFWKHVLETIAVGLLPVGTFILIYEYDTRKEYQKMVRNEFQGVLHDMARRCGECEKLGLHSLSDKRDPEKLVEPFRTTAAGETISVLGVALADLTDFERNREVLDAIRRGCKVRLLYLDADCQEARTHSLEEKRGPEEVTDHIKGTQGNWQNDKAKLPSGVRNLLAIKKYRAIPKHFLLIYPKGVYVGHYLRGRRGNESPHFLIAPGSVLAEQYITHFDELWKAGVPV